MGVVSVPAPAASAAPPRPPATAAPHTAEDSALRLKRRGGPETFRAHPVGGGRTLASYRLSPLRLAHILNLSPDW